LTIDELKEEEQMRLIANYSAAEWNFFYSHGSHIPEVFFSLFRDRAL